MKKLDVRSRITEIDDVTERILVLFERETQLQEEVFLKPTFAQMKTIAKQITEAIKRDVASSKLEEADLRRDNWVRSLNTALLGYRALPVQSLKENAETLYTIFSKYGVKITKENYAVESSLIESLLQDLSADELKEPIKALVGIGEIISQLRTEQTAFTTLRAEHEKSVSQQKNAPTATELKKTLLELINAKLVPYLIAMKIANSAQYEPFANAVEQIITDTNEVVKRRNKKSKSEKQK